MRASRIRPAAIALLALLVGALASAAFAAGVPDSHEREARYFVVTKWNSGCNEHLDNLPKLDNMIDNWYDNLTSGWRHGSKEWNREGRLKNGDIVDSQFIDEDIVSWGNDHGSGNLDKVDAMMVGLHGDHMYEDGPWRGAVRVDEYGVGNCETEQSQMDLGDLDLEFLHIVSCHSMCEAHEGGRNWKTSFDRLHQVNGFYGIAYESGSFTDEYKWFADDAFDISIAHSWLDNLYMTRSETGYQEQCPTSHVQGVNDDSAVARIANEEYDYVYDDASPGVRYYYYAPTCNPKEHNP